MVLGFIGPLADIITTIPTAVSGGLAIYLFGVIGMQGIALMMAEKVNLYDPKQLAIGATILIVGIGGNIGFPGGFLPIPLLQGVFPSGWPAIATAAVFGILMNLITLAWKPPVVRGAVEDLSCSSTAFVFFGHLAPDIERYRELVVNYEVMVNRFLHLSTQEGKMILVTGAAGKTGRAVVRALVKAGLEIRALVHRFRAG